MKFVFRTDASLAIGTGHVMRCLTLADAVRVRGASCDFICREHPGHLMELIRARGFTVHKLPRCDPGHQRQDADETVEPAHAPWLGCDWSVDAQKTSEVLASLSPDWLVVDHYALDSRWENALRAYYGKLLVLDDLADRPHVCDLLVDQNLGRTPLDYARLVPERCTVLAGPQFALLRPEFAALREYSLQRRQVPVLKQLLVFMGGVDQPNATGQVLEALRSCSLPADCRITVVMGGQAPWLSQVRTIAATMPWPTEVYINISNMAKVMADSDLAIGAAGTTSWERCSLGLPVLVAVQAENQWPGARALVAAGAARLIGEASAIREQLAPALTPVLDRKALSNMSRFAGSISDGQGCGRVVGTMEALL